MGESLRHILLGTMALLVWAAPVYPHGSAAPPVNTLEDFFFPVGDSWQFELGFLVSEGFQELSESGYGITVDDVVVSWAEFHPITQTANNCAVGGLEFGGQCASISLANTSNTFEGENLIDVSVTDPFPGSNLGQNGCAANEISVEAYSVGEREPETFCLTDDGSGVHFEGTVATTTRLTQPGDGRVYLAFSGGQAPELIVQYLDEDDGVHTVAPGADGQPGIAGFDDDDDGTVDEADELCPKRTNLGSGRSPHVRGTPARYSDDTCGCPDNPLVDRVLASFQPADVVVTDVTVDDGTSDGTGDADGWADPGEEVVVQLSIRNLSDFDLQNVRIKVSTDSPLIDCLTDDEILIPFLTANDLTPLSGADEVVASDTISFISGGLGARTSVDELLESTFRMTLSASGLPTAQSSLDADFEVPVVGFAVPQSFRVVHNLSASQTPTPVADYVETFEEFTTTGTGNTGDLPGPTSLLGTGFVDGRTQWQRFSTGDQPAELDGNRCQRNDPANRFGFNTDPQDFCELGGGFPADENHWHLNFPSMTACEGAMCPDGRSHSPGNHSLSLSNVFDGATGEVYADGHTHDYNRMRWIETANSMQLGLDDPQMEYWTQMSLLDARLFAGRSLPEGMDAGLTYVCVDADDNDACDSTETGDLSGRERWVPIRAWLNPPSQFRVSNAVNCTFDPTDDGNSEDDFFVNATIDGPNSTCAGAAVNTCVGHTNEPIGFFPMPLSSEACFPESPFGGAPIAGVYELDRGSGGIRSTAETLWARKIFDLQPFAGRKILFRFHVSPFHIFGIDNCAQLGGGQCRELDDGWFIDDIRVSGLSSEFDVAIDNDGSAQTCAAVGECGSVDAQVALIRYPRVIRDVNNQLVNRPASACSTGFDCDFDGDATVDAALDSAPLDAPGLASVLTAETSLADSCLGGTLEYRFERSGGALLRDFHTSPDVLISPATGEVYDVTVRCSSDPTCVGSASVGIGFIDCFDPVFDLLFIDKQTFVWTESCPLNRVFDVTRFDVQTVSAASGDFSSGVCLEDDGNDETATDATNPAPGSANGYTVRRIGMSYNSGGASQSGDRDSTTTACP